ncbi:hypothetical protein [Parabacteroides sp. PF5-6]|uniref:hypothetical protein n=1 Tax=Parabacteroides sp. PF5-6 TaxID=1742403 RepID=UPI002405394D|nr:hypothetical protein [Parabacteroides sp. PF5-6]
MLSSHKGKSLTIDPLSVWYDFTCYVTGKNTTPPSIYHTIHLEVADGIDLYNFSAGNHQVEDGAHLHLQFLPEDRTLTADDVLFLIDGIETSFNDFGAGNYYSHILNPIEQDHTVLIALREYPVTLTETEGVTYSIGAGTHQVAYGEKFSFSLTLAEGIDPADVHVIANGIEIEPDALRAAVLTYTIDKVISPITVVIEGTGGTTGNIQAGETIRLEIVNCQLSIINSGQAIDVNVYSLTGKHVVSLRGLRGSKTLSLEPGIYLVKAGDKVYKVSVY